MIGAIIGAIIGGLIIGALARLVLPGKQNISVPMTIGIGMVSSFVASLIVGAVGYRNANGIAWIPLIVGVVVAALIISWYSKRQIGSRR